MARDKKVMMRLNDYEYEILKEKAEKMNLTVSEYARMFLVYDEHARRNS